MSPGEEVPHGSPRGTGTRSRIVGTSVNPEAVATRRTGSPSTVAVALSPRERSAGCRINHAEDVVSISF